MSYGEVINDYKVKIGKSKELEDKLEQEEKRLSEIELKYKKENEQATRVLESITKGIATVQDTFDKQKNELKAQLDEYIYKSKLSWKKVNTAVALFDTELSESGMRKSDIARLSERINYVGSLFNIIKRLEQQQSRLKSKVDELSRKDKVLSTRIKALENQDRHLKRLISENMEILDRIETNLESERKECEELKQTAYQYRENLYLSHLIIDFLFAPDSINDYDLDRFVSLMIVLRQKRLGIGPKQVVDSNDKVVCECQIPKIYGKISLSDDDIDHARTGFAHLLTPLVKDKFISRFDFDMAETQHQIEVINAVNQERNRHLF